MYNRILKRPMFKRGGSSYQSQGTGITSPYDTPRKNYKIGSWGEWEDQTRKITKDPRGDFSYAAQGFSSLGNPYKESGEAKTIGEMLWEGAQGVRGSKEKASDLERSGELAILQSKGDRILAEETHKKQKELAQIKAASLLNKDYSTSRSIQELQKEIFKQSDDFSFEKQNSFGLAQGMYYISKLLEANPSEQVDIISIFSPQDNEGKVFGFDETKLVVDKVWWDPKMKRWAVFGDTDGDGYANGKPQYFGSYNEASIALVKGISTTDTTNNADNPTNIKPVNAKGDPIKKGKTHEEMQEDVVQVSDIIDKVTDPKTWEGTVGGNTRGYGINQNVAQKATGGRVGYEEGTPDPEIKELDMLTNWWKENLSGWNKNEG